MVFGSSCGMSKYSWLPCETREVTVAYLGCKYAFEKQQHIEVILMSVLYVEWTSWPTLSTLHCLHQSERWGLGFVVSVIVVGCFCVGVFFFLNQLLD